MNHRELILRAACTLGDVFTPPSLVVACWESDHETFGLDGYRQQYPAAHKVYSKLYGESGLIRRELIEDTPGGLRVSVAGRRAVVAPPMEPREPDLFADTFAEVQRLSVENALLRRQVRRLRAKRELELPK